MYYTSEENVQILIALLKKHNVSKIIASPGTMNISFVGSVQTDNYFTIYSAPDERSAAYMACGLAKECNEPVVITCTGATASRNYIPGLTEAFYSKIPIISVTFSQPFAYIGQNRPQVMDRRTQLNDMCIKSVQIPVCRSPEDIWATDLMINDALLAATSNASGPVHINIVSECSTDFSIKKLPNVRKIDKFTMDKEFPPLPKGRIGIYVGAHNKWTKNLIKVVDKFCELNNSVVFCDRTGNYEGKYAIYPSLVCSQDSYISSLRSLDLLIYIGNVFGTDMVMNPSQVWRVNPDGVVRDTFGNLSAVFETTEEVFFSKYIEMTKHNESNNEYYLQWNDEVIRFEKLIPELPYSNLWCAKTVIEKIPEQTTIHFGILNSLRCWSLMYLNKFTYGYSNTGGFGIDGCISTLIGASLANSNQLYFGVIGDLAFFYDMNVLGNRHVGNNIRLMLVNNGKGTEFRMYNHPGNIFKEQADCYISAGNHYGCKSSRLVKNYAENLGFEYISATNKEEFIKNLKKFLSPYSSSSKSLIFEVFTTSEDESAALYKMRNLVVDNGAIAKNKIKKAAKNLLGENVIKTVKKIIKK